MSPPLNNRQDLVVGHPRSDADAQVEFARIEWRGQIIVALIGLAGVCVGAGGALAWRLLS